MALSDSRKLDLVFKALLGREETTTAKAWYEEFANHATYLHKSEIYGDDIPSTPPSSSTSTIEVYDTLELTLDNTVSGSRCWKARQTPGNSNSPQLTHFIHPRFGQGYTARIYDNNDNEIPTTDPSNWYFFYETGILIFENSPLNYGWQAPFKLKAYRYVGSFGFSTTTYTKVVDRITLTQTDINNGYVYLSQPVSNDKHNFVFLNGILLDEHQTEGDYWISNGNKLNFTTDGLTQLQVGDKLIVKYYCTNCIT